jgi:hypothetical protein
VPFCIWKAPVLRNASVLFLACSSITKRCCFVFGRQQYDDAL